MTLTNLSAAQLRQAATLQDKINSLQSELGRILGSATATGGGGGKQKRTMSAAARERMSQLAKARWAKAKASGKKSL